MVLPRRLVWPGLCGLLSGLPGCGGGTALLHPAHALPSEQVTAGAGVAATFAFEDGGGARSTGPASATAPGDEVAALEVAAARSALAPGVSPWFGARVGLGAGNEAGVTYTGRAVRMDGRHAFSSESVALSVGLGASAILLRKEDDPRTPTTGDRLGPRSGTLSYGVDLPVVVGWRSAASVVEAWAGVRGGAEWLNGDLALGESADGERIGAPVDARRLHAGGLIGLSVGLRPITLALELDAAYQSVSAEGAFPRGGASIERRSASLAGLTLSPAAAILGKF